jgi:hypothetical protein
MFGRWRTREDALKADLRAAEKRIGNYIEALGAAEERARRAELARARVHEQDPIDALFDSLAEASCTCGDPPYDRACPYCDLFTELRKRVGESVERARKAEETLREFLDEFDEAEGYPPKYDFLRQAAALGEQP